MLDFLAGFLPGVGEAQDAHDFYHAAKNRDFGGMALSIAGLAIPAPIGLTSLIGLKAFNKDNEQKDKF